MVFGEIKSDATIDFQTVVRDAVRHIGYDHSEKGFDGNTCNVLVAIEQQSPDIAQAVHENRTDEDLAAGDQVILHSSIALENVVFDLIFSNTVSRALISSRV